MSSVKNSLPRGNSGGQLSGMFPNPDVVGITETLGPTRLHIGEIADGEILIRDGNNITGGTIIGGDEQVKITALDDSAGYLTDKISTDSSLTSTVLNSSNDEQLQLSVVFGTTAGISAQGNDARFSTANEKAALAGTAGLPSVINKYVTDADPRLSGGSGTSGIATVNFGTTTLRNSSVTFVVSGQASISATSFINTWVRLAPTTDHTLDEIFAENLEVLGGNIIPGSSFTIYASVPRGRTYGNFQINWNWK